MNKRNYLNRLCFILIILILSSCRSNSIQESASVPATSHETTGDEQDVMANLYQQKAAEYRALCLQGYNLASRKLEESIQSKKKKGLPLCVITDLDETALDNSAYEVQQYLNHSTYEPLSWKKWCDSAIADSVPGSVSFFKWVNSEKIAIFYVSNRDTSVLEKTMLNMKKLGFPQIERNHFYFQTDTSSKEPRRKEIEKTHSVAVLLGDNLIDLDSIFDKASTENRLKSVDILKKQWGDKYIVFPNSVYGDWENALYYDYEKKCNVKYPSQSAIDSIRLSNLHGF